MMRKDGASLQEAFKTIAEISPDDALKFVYRLTKKEGIKLAQIPFYALKEFVYSRGVTVNELIDWQENSPEDIREDLLIALRYFLNNNISPQDALRVLSGVRNCDAHIPVLAHLTGLLSEKVKELTYWDITELYNAGVSNNSYSLHPNGYLCAWLQSKYDERLERTDSSALRFFNKKIENSIEEKALNRGEVMHL